MRLSIAAIGMAFVPASWALALTSTTTSFQNGVNGYTGTVDMRISMTASADGTSGANPTTNYQIDGYRPDDLTTPMTNEFSPDAQGLIRFDNMFGNGGGQIPEGAFILNSNLQIKTTNGSAANTGGPWGVAALNQDFTSATRYTDFPSSADPNLTARGPWWEDGYASRPIGAVGSLANLDLATLDTRALVQKWSGDVSTRHGLTLQAGYDGTSDGWTIFTSGTPTVSQRPKLTVEYTTSPISLKTFQRDLNGYAGDTSARILSGDWQTSNATLHPDASDDDITYDGFSGNPTISATFVGTPPTPLTGNGFQAFLDGPQPHATDAGRLTSQDQFGIFKFGNVFGADANQSPADKPVAKAWLVLTTGDTSGNARSPQAWDVHAMLRDWDAPGSADPNDPMKPTLYSEFGAVPGLQTDDGDIGPTLATAEGMITGSEVWFDVTSYFEAVRAGATDYGLAVEYATDTTDGWQIHLSGSDVANARPRLVIASDLSVVTPPGVLGDYNGNGIVDAADYVLWRKGGPLLNEVATAGSVTAEDYTEWRARFGNTSGSGSSLGGAAVPEPASVALGLIASCGLCLCSSRKRQKLKEPIWVRQTFLPEIRGWYQPPKG